MLGLVTSCVTFLMTLLRTLVLGFTLSSVSPLALLFFLIVIFSLVIWSPGSFYLVSSVLSRSPLIGNLGRVSPSESLV